MSADDLARQRTAPRVAAVVLPSLACELVRARFGVQQHLRDGSKRARTPPLGVVIVEAPSALEPTAGEPVAVEPVKATALLDAVSESARRYGVREGQSIAEACALVAHLVVQELPQSTLRAALGRVAELGLAFGATVAFESPDTVWIDVTGAAHLFGGELPLAAELAARVRALGHTVRVAVASGPRVAQALARWASPGTGQAEALGERGALVVPADQTQRAVAALPVAALPVAPQLAAWLVRLGVLTFEDLTRLPRAAAAARLGDRASAVLDLAEGKDDEPLIAYRPPSVLREESTWDEPADGIEPLSFVLRGLVARLSARLAGRGEAAQKLVLTVQGDRAVARHRGVAANKVLVFDLASPLWRAEELGRVVAARLARARLATPSVGLVLEAPAVIRALGRQLDLSRVCGGVTGNKGLESLPVLLAELAMDVGQARLGVLALSDSHRPEKKSELRPALEEPSLPRPPRKAKRERTPLSKVRPVSSRRLGAPTRLLPSPVPIGAALRVGATLRIDHRLYTIEHVGFVERLEAVEWWTPSPVARDYLQLWLRGADGGLEARVYVDRESGKRFLHAVAD